MADTVSVTSAAGADYTWANSTWAWTDTRAGKTWATSYATDYDLDIGVSLTLAETASRDLDKALSDAFAVTDSAPVHSITKSFGESVAFAETYVDYVEWIVAISENISLAEVGSRNTTIPHADSFGISDDSNREITKNVLRDLTLAESMTQAVTFNRAFSESFVLSEGYANNFTLPHTESFSVADKYVRHANGVISDLTVRDEVIDADTFDELFEFGSPPGFSTFKNHITGDYTYEKAIFRTVMETESTDRGYLTDLTLVVDMPDVTDKGQETITTASTGISVTFDRTFVVTPEVTITHIGGTSVAIPRITTSSKTGFTAVLEDTSGSKVTGTISWIAQGY